MQIKKDVKQEREQLSLKLEQFNELIAMYGAPQTSPRIASCSENIVSQVPDKSSTGREVRHVPISPALNKDSVKVDLFGDGIPKDVVAKGILVSKDPKEKVADMPLGPDHWKVFLEEAVCPSYILSGSGDNAFTVGQAIISFLAWPSDQK
ncbi:hypothetical protein LIER_33889 [Lithospermum erythrorhizon]|uniref:Uncharacterized protein n=1 Tax=Lithospermum erythrorhizon TaxID=34254 RepID=A0AAV3S2S7_LITER